MAFLVGGANSLADTGYDIDNSLRLDFASSAYLYRDQVDPTSEGQIYTVSVWNKICFPDGQNAVLLEGGDPDGSGATVDETWIMHNTAGTLFFQDALNDATVLGKQTASLQRDVSAWYHFMLSVDTTQGTDTNRLKVYINGENVSANMTGGWPVQNVVHQLNKQVSGSAQLEHWIGRHMRSTNYSDMYIADLAFVDGTQLAPSNFGETDEDSGIWKPKAPDVSAWGDNGFFLEFKNSAVGTGASDTIGADTSGNDNHFTSSGVAVTDHTTDTPTNNFATLNPLTCGDVLTQTPTLAEGNCQFTSTSSSSQGTSADGTIAPSSGKWYWEVKCTTTIRNGMSTGIIKVEGYKPSWQGDSYFYGANSSIGSTGYGYNYNTGKPQTNAGDSTTNQGSAISTNDIVGVALDLDNGALYYSINGTFQASSDPTSGGSKTNAQHSFTAGDSYAPAIYGYQTTTFQVNFGNPPYANSSDAADAAGYGAFEYAPPSGYYALCTKNLAEYG